MLNIDAIYETKSTKLKHLINHYLNKFVVLRKVLFLSHTALGQWPGFIIKYGQFEVIIIIVIIVIVVKVIISVSTFEKPTTLLPIYA